MVGDRAPRLLVASERVYRALLYLYPAEHRRECGPLMAQAFHDLARAAWRRRGRRGLAGLWLRTLADLARSVPREHLASEAQGGAIGMEDRPVTPLPWWQVALATLPGLVLLAGVWPGVRALIPLARTGLFTIAGATSFVRRFGLPLCLLPAIMAWARTRRFPAWGLTALGALVGLAAGGFFVLGWIGLLAAVVYMLVVQARERTIPGWAWVALAGAINLTFVPDLYGGTGLFAVFYVGATLLAALLALPLARRHGPAAGLAVVAVSLAGWEAGLGMDYGLAGTPWGDAMRSTLALLLVAAPIWVLRARSTRGQAWGLLVPAAVALALSAGIDAVVRADPGIFERAFGYGPPAGLVIGYGSRPGQLLPLLLRACISVVQTLLALVVMVALYARPGAQHAEAAEEEAV